jgi:hypothetical protein
MNQYDDTKKYVQALNYLDVKDKELNDPNTIRLFREAIITDRNAG